MRALDFSGPEYALPPWVSTESRNDAEMLLGGRSSDIRRELYGETTDTGMAFPGELVERFRKRKPVRLEPRSIQRLVTFVDPNNAGRSRYSMCTVAFTGRGVFLLAVDDHCGRFHDPHIDPGASLCRPHVLTVLKHPAVMESARLLFIAESNTGNANHLASVLGDIPQVDLYVGNVAKQQAGFCMSAKPKLEMLRYMGELLRTESIHRAEPLLIPSPDQDFVKYTQDQLIAHVMNEIADQLTRFVATIQNELGMKVLVLSGKLTPDGKPSNLPDDLVIALSAACYFAESDNTLTKQSYIRPIIQV